MTADKSQTKLAECIVTLNYRSLIKALTLRMKMASAVIWLVLSTACGSVWSYPRIGLYRYPLDSEHDDDLLHSVFDPDFELPGPGEHEHDHGDDSDVEAKPGQDDEWSPGDEDDDMAFLEELFGSLEPDEKDDEKPEDDLPLSNIFPAWIKPEHISDAYSLTPPSTLKTTAIPPPKPDNSIPDIIFDDFHHPPWFKPGNKSDSPFPKLPNRLPPPPDKNSEVPPPPKPEIRDETDFPFKFDELKKFHFVKKQMDWTSAAKYCVKNFNRSRLVVIDCEKTQKQLAAYLDRFDAAKKSAFRSLWVGGQRYEVDTLSSFVWKVRTDSRSWLYGRIEPLQYYLSYPMTYTNWAKGEPDNYQERESCLTIRAHEGYAWNDADCATRHHFVCEEELVPWI